MVTKQRIVEEILTNESKINLPLPSRSSSPLAPEGMIERACCLADMSLETLEEVARYGEKDSDRIAAAIHLLDRGYGKPMQAIAIRKNEGNTIDAQYEEVFGKE